MEKSYNNLLDIIIEQEKQPQYMGNPSELFRYLVMNCFFKIEAEENRQFHTFLERFDIPFGFSTVKSLLEMDVELIRTIINGESIDKSFAARIMFSKIYLKYFQPHHPNDFSKIPNDIKIEMRREAISKNEAIVAGFQKAHDDMNADKKRTVLALIALCMKNINRRTGRPIRNIDMPIADIIREHMPDCDDIFKGSPTQLVLLHDVAVVRNILKRLFVIKSYSELKKVSDLFLEEVERFRKRAELAFPPEK